MVIVLEDEGVTNWVKQWSGSPSGMAFTFFFFKQILCRDRWCDNPLKKHCTKGQQNSEVVTT